MSFGFVFLVSCVKSCVMCHVCHVSAAAAWESTLCRDIGLPSAWSVTTRETESIHTSSHLITPHPAHRGLMGEGQVATRGWTESAGGRKEGVAVISADFKTLLPKHLPGLGVVSLNTPLRNQWAGGLLFHSNVHPPTPIQPMRRRFGDSLNQESDMLLDWVREGVISPLRRRRSRWGLESYMGS